jgi:uncharacterized membrane protein
MIVSWADAEEIPMPAQFRRLQRAAASMSAADMNAAHCPRLPLIDALRGFAVAQMIVYHFIYDLNYFGWAQLAMNRDQPWIGWRTAIVSQFLLLVGVSLVLRLRHKPGWRDFALRWAQVAAAAALVSLGSGLMFGPRLIYFGILHFIAVALIVARLLAPLHAWNLALAAAAFVAWLVYRDPLFNAFPANIIGFVTAKPRTEDYVPLFPWIAVVLAGVGLGSLWQRRGFPLWAPAQRFNRRPPRMLVLLGTWALTVYLIHQPIMIGLLWLVRTVA